MTIIRGHFDLQASSNGRKYLSASIKGCFPLGGGRADDGLSSLETEQKISAVNIALSCKYHTLLQWFSKFLMCPISMTVWHWLQFRWTALVCVKTIVIYYNTHQ